MSWRQAGAVGILQFWICSLCLFGAANFGFGVPMATARPAFHAAGWHAFVALGARLAAVPRVVAHVGNHPDPTAPRGFQIPAPGAAGAAINPPPGVLQSLCAERGRQGLRCAAGGNRGGVQRGAGGVVARRCGAAGAVGPGPLHRGNGSDFAAP